MPCHAVSCLVCSCGVVWCGVVWCGVVWCGVVVWECGGGVRGNVGGGMWGVGVGGVGSLGWRFGGMHTTSALDYQRSTQVLLGVWYSVRWRRSARERCIHAIGC